MAVDTINPKVPSDRRYSRPYSITPSDVVADKNLQRNGVPYRWLQNCGAGGLVMIRWLDGTEIEVYLAQGQEIELGLPVHLKTTGTTAGGPFRAFLAIEGGSR